MIIVWNVRKETGDTCVKTCVMLALIVRCVDQTLVNVLSVGVATGAIHVKMSVKTNV